MYKRQLYKINGDAAKKVATIPGAIAVVALVQGSDGAVYAGTLPGDTIWKIDVASGKATKAATIKGVETVWSLAVAPGGTVYAGTGPDGKLFSIDKKGASREVFATDDKRVTAATVTSDGAVWFGTSERALVFRFDPKTGTTRAMSVTSLPAKSAIARVVPLAGSWRKSSASSEVPNQMAPSSVATIDRMRLSSLAKTILAWPLFGSTRKSLPSGPVPA